MVLYLTLYVTPTCTYQAKVHYRIYPKYDLAIQRYSFIEEQHPQRGTGFKGNTCIFYMSYAFVKH